MAQESKRWDLKWIFGTAIAVLTLWVGWQQFLLCKQGLELAELQVQLGQQGVNLAKLQMDEQAKKDAAEVERKLDELREKRWPKLTVTKNGDTVYIKAVKVHPITKAETVTEIVTTEAGWKDLHDQLINRRLSDNEPPPPVPIK